MSEQLAPLMDAIRAEAAAKRVTIKALAKAADVSYVAMRRYLAYADTDRPMNLSQLYRVADALGVTVEYLAGEGARRAKQALDDAGAALADHIRSLGGSEQDVIDSLRIVTGDQDVAGSTVDLPEEARGKRRRGRRAQ